MMEINESTINICIESLMAQVADAYAEDHGISVTDALRMFLTTKTYELLSRPRSELYMEPWPYVLRMLEAELMGDWDTWLDVQ